MIKKLPLFILLLMAGRIAGQTYVMSNGSISACSGTHLDPGGTGSYADNSNFQQTICSTAGNCVSLTFTAFNLETGFDFLYIYDGAGTSSPQVPGSPFTGSTLPGTVTCTGGCMTLVFTSDISIPATGWSATISCGACPPPPPPPDYTFAWSQRESVPAGGRHRGVGISIGSRGYAGLGHINAVTDILYDDWWEYDPGTNSWTQKANFPPGPRMHPCGFTIGNYGYVGTGRNSAGAEQADLWRYDPSTNSWAMMAPMPGPSRRGAVAFAVSGKGYVGTGSYSSDFWCYDPGTNSWASIPPFPGGSRISSVAFAIGNKGYVGTGDNGGPTGDFYEFDPATNTWTPKASLTGLPRMEAAGFSLFGKGYIGTGCDYQSGNNYQDFWRYDPSSNTWLQVADFSGVARRYMSCFTIGSRAYGVFGTSGTNYNDLWEYGNYNAVDEQESQLHLDVYPNPFSERIFFRSSEPLDDACIVLYDVYGRRVLSLEHIHGSELELRPGHLQHGFYFYELRTAKGNITGKLIAQ